MSTDLPDILAYYARTDSLTTLPDSDAIRALKAGLPTAIPDLVRVVQNNLLHIFWAERYGVTLTDERRAEVQTRTTAARLQCIYDADPAPLTTARAPEKRSVGNCRDFTLTLVTLLRERGVPARARCGFGAYFEPQKYIDHWVAEYWNADQGRWIMVDAQMDALQSEVLKLDFDPLDVPHHRFITGGHAWQMIRQEGANPDDFGIMDLHGPWFIRGDLLRDFAALNKVELLPWDSWGIMLKDDADMTEEDNALLDRVAALTLAGNAGFDDLRALYNADARLTVPPVILSFPTGPEPVSITLVDVPGWAESDPTTKAALLAQITKERRRLDALLAALSDADLLQPNVVGFWSIKDVLAHLVSWEQRYLDWYRAGQRGAGSGKLEPNLSEQIVDEMNQRSYEQHRDCTLAEVRTLYANSYREMLAAIDAMSEDEIFRVGYYSWTGKWPMLAYLGANTSGHYAEHAAQIEAWQKR